MSCNSTKMTSLIALLASALLSLAAPMPPLLLPGLPTNSLGPDPRAPGIHPLTPDQLDLRQFPRKMRDAWKRPPGWEVTTVRDIKRGAVPLGKYHAVFKGRTSLIEIRPNGCISVLSGTPNIVMKHDPLVGAQVWNYAPYVEGRPNPAFWDVSTNQGFFHADQLTNDAVWDEIPQEIIDAANPLWIDGEEGLRELEYALDLDPQPGDPCIFFWNVTIGSGKDQRFKEVGVY